MPILANIRNCLVGARVPSLVLGFWMQMNRRWPVRALQSCIPCGTGAVPLIPSSQAFWTRADWWLASSPSKARIWSNSLLTWFILCQGPSWCVQINHALWVTTIGHASCQIPLGRRTQVLESWYNHGRYGQFFSTFRIKQFGFKFQFLQMTHLGKRVSHPQTPGTFHPPGGTLETTP